MDKQHKLTITEKGRIIRCSDYCTDLRLKYREVLETDPGLAAKMTELEGAAQAAAKSKSKSKADKTSADAAKFEHVLKKAERDRKYLFGMDEAEIDEALATIDAPAVTGGPATGMKIGGKKIPRGRNVKVGRKKVKMPRRRGDVDDFRTEAELRDAKTGFSKAMDRIGKVMGRKISDIPELRAAWDSAVADVLGKRKIGKLSKAEMLEAYAKARKKFWDHVRADPKAKQFLKDHGFELPGESGAALAVLGPKGKETNRGKITDQERRISLDHIEEKAQGENWQKALDADNLELMFHNANSWKEIVQMKFGMRDGPQ